MERLPDFYNHNYNNESNLIEELYEFHPEHFDKLSSEDYEALKKYYLFSTPTSKFPENIFAYRDELLQKDHQIELRAKSAYAKLLSIAGIEV